MPVAFTRRTFKKYVRAMSSAIVCVYIKFTFSSRTILQSDRTYTLEKKGCFLEHDDRLWSLSHQTSSCFMQFG